MSTPCAWPSDCLNTAGDRGGPAPGHRAGWLRRPLPARPVPGRSGPSVAGARESASSRGRPRRVESRSRAAGRQRGCGCWGCRPADARRLAGQRDRKVAHGRAPGVGGRTRCHENGRCRPGHLAMMDKVTINRLVTGVPGLDAILGGGLPELSFNLLAGPPGCGKKTLAHQMMFALATPKRPALYITVLGEPPLKMLRYQQQFAFFDGSAVGTSIHFVNMSDCSLTGDVGQLLGQIVTEVQVHRPAFLFVDSFRCLAQATGAEGAPFKGMQHFLQQLGVLMTTWPIPCARWPTGWSGYDRACSATRWSAKWRSARCVASQRCPGCTRFAY